MRYDPKLTRAQAYRKGMEAIREGIGENAFLLGCGSPYGPSIGLVDAMRIGPDTAPNWNPYLFNMKFATPFIKGETGIGALRNNIRQTLNMSIVHRRWWWSDPDCLMVRDYDTKLSDDEILSNVSLIGLMGGLVINSDDLTRLSPERQRLVALLCPVLSRGGRPLDLLEREMAEIYDLPMSAAWGEWHVAAAFNWSDHKRKKTISPVRLGFPAGARLHVHDFWSNTHSVAEGPIDLGQVPPHGCRLLRLTAVTGQPRIVGSTLHITQGGEIESLCVEKATMRVIVKDLGRRVEGELLFSLPRQPHGVMVGETPTDARDRGDGVWSIPLKARGRVAITVAMEKSSGPNDGA